MLQGNRADPERTTACRCANDNCLDLLAARLQHAVREKGIGNYDAASGIEDPNAIVEGF
jgi:hypothetical protein